MESKLHVGNLSKATTEEELKTLFAQAGNVMTVDVIKERKSRESKGFAFITMSAPGEAENAIGMFNAYSLAGHELKVSMARPREQRPITNPIVEP